MKDDGYTFTRDVTIQMPVLTVKFFPFARRRLAAAVAGKHRKRRRLHRRAYGHLSFYDLLVEATDKVQNKMALFQLGPQRPTRQ